MKPFQKIILLVCILLSGTLPAFSQCQGTCGGNLIPNPGFELTTPFCNTMLPMNDRQVIYTDQAGVQSWVGMVPAPPGGIDPTGGSPDYFSPCANFYPDALVCSSDEAAVGIFTYEHLLPTDPQYREYIQAQLLSPLVAGHTYCFSVTVVTPRWFDFGDQFGAWFYNTGPVTQAMNGGDTFFGAGSIINAHPQIQNPPGNYIDTTCQIITGTFCAQGGESWIMLGNFTDDAGTHYLPGGNTINGACYLAMDNLSLYEVCRDASITATAGSITCGQSTTLSAHSNSNDTALTYTWYSSAGDTLHGPGPHVVSPVDTTTYHVIVSSPSLCTSGTDSVTINVFCGLATSLNDTVICSGECYNLLAGPSPGGVPPLSYTWTPAVGGTTAGPYSVCPTATTIYHVSVTDASGASAMDSAIVTVLPNPVADAGADVTICLGDSVQLTGITDAGTSQWINVPAATNYTVAPTVSSAYYLEAQNNGCSTFDTVNITVVLLPVSSFTADPAFMYEDHPLTLITNSSQDCDSCVLDLGDGTVLTGCYDSFRHAYAHTGMYTLTQTVMNAEGCSDTSSITVQVAPLSALWVPNAFSPGRSVNGIFYAKGTSVSEFDMKIFNRWGELLFESTDMSKGWDGTFHNRIVEQDTYVWLITYSDYKGNYKEMKGIVTVLY